jgi:hypothetical protein
MKLVRTKGPFITSAHHAVSRKAGEIFMLLEEDYEEVKDMCEVLDEEGIVDMFDKKNDQVVDQKNDTKKKPSRAKE